ncbi:MAG: hypothetical protein RIC55_28615 [Pirellulaceae bacterium]
MSVVEATCKPSAADLVIRYTIRLSAAAERMLDPGMSPPRYYQALRRAGLEVDARRVLAYSMPKRRALWWGCLCAWDGLRDKASERELAALRAVSDFVLLPSDERRRAAREARRRTRQASPAFTLAAAAFFSAGSISTPGGHPVLAPEHLTGRLVAVTVYLAAAVREARRYRTHLRHYLTLGEEIAQGEHLWPVADAASLGRHTVGPTSIDSRSTNIASAQPAEPHFTLHSSKHRLLLSELTGEHKSCGCRHDSHHHQLQEA